MNKKKQKNFVNQGKALALSQAPEITLTEAKALLASGDTRTALALLQLGRLQHPEHAGIALLFADALHAAGRLKDAVAAYAAGLKLDEISADGWFGAGCAQLALKSYGAAATALARAATLAPQSGAVQYNLAKAQFELGRVEDSIKGFQRAAQLDPTLAQMARASIACIIPGSSQADHAAVLRARREWAAQEARGLAPRARAAAPALGRKLRIGYLSAFFGARNWMKPVFALINRHDRDRFEIHMFSDADPPSAASGYRDHDADYVHDLRGVSNDRAAQIIGDIGIDVLVDLNGYSYQSRLPLLMLRPARRIVGWFNMFATTGVAAFDWLIGDNAVIGKDEEKYYCERIHRLPGSYLAFEILYSVPEVAPPPCVAAGGAITFGCFGSQYKLTDAVLVAWARIMHAVPRARLLLKNGMLDDQSTREDLLGRLAALGIDAARIELQGRSEHYEFLEAYRQVDIALDTFPYNGGTTTTEALWQGVPVLTFDGDRWASRTSKSLLLAAGLQEWVMQDVHEYVHRAVSLTMDSYIATKLSALRQDMRSLLKRSQVYDADGLCHAMETFCFDIWREQQSQ